MTGKTVGKYLWDARSAAELILLYIEGRSFEQYLTVSMLKPAVERQFERRIQVSERTPTRSALFTPACSASNRLKCSLGVA
jgi:hypothetical protein